MSVDHAAAEEEPSSGSDATRDRILREAARLFVEQGYAATTMRMIAAAAGITAGSIYWHFPSKESILYAYLSAEEEMSKRKLEDSLTAATPAKRLRGFIRTHVSHQYGHEMGGPTRWVGPHGVRQLARFLPAQQREHIRQLERDQLELLRDILQEGVAAGEFRQLDITPTAFAIIAMCEQVPDWWKPDGRLTLVEVAALYEDLVHRMVAHV